MADRQGLRHGLFVVPQSYVTLCLPHIVFQNLHKLMHTDLTNDIKCVLKIVYFPCIFSKVYTKMPIILKVIYLDPIFNGFYLCSQKNGGIKSWQFMNSSCDKNISQIEKSSITNFEEEIFCKNITYPF